MLALIGSAAWNITQNANIRKPKDVDLVGHLDECINYVKTWKTAIHSSYPINGGKKWVLKCYDGTIFECELTWPKSSAAELLELIEKSPYKSYPHGVLTADLDTLYMLKMSHRYLKNSPHFLKTMRDIQEMRKQGARIKPEHMDFYKRREKATYTYSHPNLNVKKADFFKGDGITYVYDHDSIHEAVKQLDRPAYTYYLEGEVKASEKKFYELPKLVRLCGVVEEAYVLALERSVVPHPGVLTPKQAFDKALMKVCTSITSGWFREFAWENYDEVQNRMYNPNYVDIFNQKLKEGVVKCL